jgi:hypothetical protein
VGGEVAPVLEAAGQLGGVEGADRRIRDAAARLVAGTVGRVGDHDPLQVGGEGGQFGRPRPDLVELGRRQVPQAGLDRCAAAAIPLRQEPGHLLEGTAEALGPPDESKAVEHGLVVGPVAGWRARRRRQQVELFVVAEGRRRKPAPLGHFGDAHGGRVNLRVDLKVKGLA